MTLKQSGVGDGVEIRTKFGLKYDSRNMKNQPEE